MLREATTADIPALIAAELACFGDEAWTPGMVREEFERAGGIQLAADAEGKLVGFAFGWLVIDELHVLHIAAMPSVRRSGVGRELLGRLVRAAGAETAWLEVRANNAPAIRLYEREGFVEVGRRPRYYADGGDAIVMRYGCALR